MMRRARSPAAAVSAGGVCVYNRTRGVCLARDAVVADTFFPRLIGLLGEGRDWPERASALWIVPSRGVHMLGMRFAIDALFLDRGKVVVHAEKNLQPWRISRVVTAARSVLELPPGTIAQTETRVGDQIEIVAGAVER